MRGRSNGMAYIHDMDVVHRDLKSENILIAAHGLGKVADFGVSRGYTAGGSKMAMTATGTSWWMAPEVARAESG